MFKLKTLELENFRSWKYLKLDNLDTFGLCLICGANGSGKSSIRQAIEYLLVDSTSENLPADHLPMNKTEECKLSCIFTKGTDVIEITKYRNSKKYGQSIILSVNGNTDLTHTDRRLTQKEINKLLNINPDILFMSTVFAKDSISFIEAKETDRKKIIYDVLDLHKYDSYFETVKNHITSCETRILELKRANINTELSIETTREDLDELIKKSKSFDSDREIEICNLKNQVTELEENKSKLVDECNRLIDESESVDLSDNKIFLSQLEEQGNELDFIKTLITTHKTMEGNLKTKISEISTGICPILNQRCYDLEYKNKIAVDKYTEELNDNSETIRLFEIQKNDIFAKIEELKKKISEYRELEIKKEDLNSIIVEHKRTINDIIKLIKYKTDEQNKLWLSSNPYLDTISKLKDRLKAYIFDSSKNENEILVLKDKLQYLLVLKIAFSKSGIPNIKSEKFLYSIEHNVNELLSLISNNIYVNIDSQAELKSGEAREKISYQIHNSESSITEYWSYSGGERQRCKLADILSFSKLIGKFNFLILDEVLELSLDSNGIDKIFELLKTRALELDTIFVVSHNNQLNDKFDSILTIRKNNGNSEVI